MCPMASREDVWTVVLLNDHCQPCVYHQCEIMHSTHGQPCIGCEHVRRQMDTPGIKREPQIGVKCLLCSKTFLDMLIALGFI